MYVDQPHQPENSVHDHPLDVQMLIDGFQAYCRTTGVFDYQQIAAKLRNYFQQQRNMELDFFTGYNPHDNDLNLAELTSLLQIIFEHYKKNNIYPTVQNFRNVIVLLETSFEYNDWRRRLNLQNNPSMIDLVEITLQNDQGNFPEMAALLRIMFQGYRWENPPDCKNFQFIIDNNRQYPSLEYFLALFNLNINQLTHLMLEQDRHINNFFYLLVTMYNNKIDELGEQYLCFAEAMEDNQNRGIAEIYEQTVLHGILPDHVNPPPYLRVIGNTACHIIFIKNDLVGDNPDDLLLPDPNQIVPVCGLSN